MSVDDSPVLPAFLPLPVCQPKEIRIVGKNDGLFPPSVFQLLLVAQTQIPCIPGRPGIYAPPPKPFCDGYISFSSV